MRGVEAERGRFVQRLKKGEFRTGDHLALSKFVVIIEGHKGSTKLTLLYDKRTPEVLGVLLRV